MTMSDPTAEFFGELARRGHEPLLRNTAGAIRFDLLDGKQTIRWHVTIDKGDVTISRKNARADAIINVDKSLFDRFARGEANVTAAVLRGEIALEGDLELAVMFQRIFPGPPSSADKRRAAGYARRQS
jgi:putative sterol carrier protein